MQSNSYVCDIFVLNFVSIQDFLLPRLVVLVTSVLFFKIIYPGHQVFYIFLYLKVIPINSYILLFSRNPIDSYISAKISIFSRNSFKYLVRVSY